MNEYFVRHISKRNHRRIIKSTLVCINTIVNKQQPATMIEQTEMMVTKWQLHTAGPTTANMTNYTILDVMRKNAATKKGLA